MTQDLGGGTPSMSKPQFTEWNIEYEEFLYRKTLEEGARLVYEIGVREGYSTHAILQALEQTGGRMVSCDIQGYRQNIHAGRPITSERWTFIQIDSIHFPRYLDETADMIYIDGDHSYGAVRSDVIGLWPFLKVGGLMILDDTQTFPHGPGEIIKRLSEAGLDARSEPVANGFGLIRKRASDPSKLEGVI